ncbi:MAG: hypothetical protein HY918_03315 [Candidatus Doudnabacteria bacterium]|nr:hypothetical protein [Candidatus Doudnabacteria bacterium]
MNNIIKRALINSFSTSAYIVLIALFFFNIEKINFGERDTVFAPIFMIMLFVFSAALTSSLMFGQPLFWYLDGKKKESLQLLGYTMGVFFLTTLIAFSCLIIFK